MIKIVFFCSVSSPSAKAQVLQLFAIICSCTAALGLCHPITVHSVFRFCLQCAKHSQLSSHPMNSLHELMFHPTGRVNSCLTMCGLIMSVYSAVKVLPRAWSFLFYVCGTQVAEFALQHAEQARALHCPRTPAIFSPAVYKTTTL